MNARSARRILAWWAGAALVTACGMPSAYAYCYTSTCGPEQPICADTQDPCGFALQWKRPCVGYGVQRDGTKKLAIEAISGAARDAFHAWTLAACEGGYPGIDVVDMGEVSCVNAEFNANAGNVNVIVFRDKSWPYPDNGEALALTTVTYANKNGEILDADIEVNTAMFNLTTDEQTVDYDLVGVLTHETGHFLGIAHSLDADSTMHGDAIPGSTELRTLTSDDTQGVCTLYPPADIDYSTCDPIPIHGYSRLCATEQFKGSCSAGTGEARAPWWLALLVGCAALASLRLSARNAR